MQFRSIALLWAVTLAGLVVPPVHAMPPNSLDYSVSATFDNTAVDPDARGTVQLTAKQRGRADIRRLRLHVSQLDGSTPYRLLAGFGEDTNLVLVSEFVTTPSGRANLVRNGTPAPKAGRAARKRALPASLNPVTTVNRVAIANTNGEVVLITSLHASDTLSLHLNSVLAPTGLDLQAIGCLSLAVQNGHAQFRLFAAGQTPSLTLCVNGETLATYPTDVAGRISVGSLPPAAPAPLDFATICLRNAGGDVILEGALR